MRYIGIDPSTKTGLVIMDEHEEVWEAAEISNNLKDPERMVKIIDTLMEFVRPEDVVVIEGFAFGAQGSAVSIQYGVGWGLRMALHRAGVKYIEAAPAALKKFASGKGNTKKDELGIEIYKRWGFEHRSDNVRDAYVLAQIARALNESVKLTVFQREVLDAIINPAEKKPNRKRKSA